MSHLLAPLPMPHPVSGARIELRYMRRAAAESVGSALLSDGEAEALLGRNQRMREGTPLFMRGYTPAQFWFQFGLHLAHAQRGSTLRQYAEIAANFARFVDERGGELRRIEEADIVEYRERRTQRISLSSWKLDATVIQAIFNFAIHVGECERIPWFVHGARNALRQPVDVEPDIRGLREEEWAQFKAVGLLGLTLDNSPDATFNRLWGMRNLAGAQLAIATGLRVQEFSSLLLPEVLSTAEHRGGFYLTVEATAKGKRRRTIYVPSGVTSRLRGYVRTDRAALVTHQRNRAPTRREGLFIVDSWAPGSQRLRGRLDGQTFAVDVKAMDVDLRRRTFYRSDDGLEPLALFVNSWGRMTSTRTWHRVFRDASDRVAQFPASHPASRSVKAHTLRHTFARRYLAYLNLEARRSEFVDEWGEIDALVLVQRALGHKSLETTALYVSEDAVPDVVEDLFHVSTEPGEEFAEIIERHLRDQKGDASGL